MTRNLRMVGVVVSMLAFSAAACRRGPKPLPLKEAAEGRRAALASVGVASLDRTFERVEAVANALSLPFEKAEVQKLFLQSLKAPEVLVNALRTDAPFAALLFAPKQKDGDPEMALAAKGKSEGALRSAIAGLGQPAAAKDDAKAFKLAGDQSVWLVQRGSTVIVATSLETLVLGGAAVMDAARPSEEDLVVHFSAGELAKSQGTDVKTAIASYLAMVSEQIKAMPLQNPVVASMVEPALRPFGDRLAEVEGSEIVVRLDPTRGATVRMSLEPRAGSMLAALIAKPSPYKLDARVLPEGDPMVLGVFGPSSWIGSLWNDLRPLFLKDKDMEAAAKQIDVLVKGPTFGGSASMGTADKQMQVQGVYGLQKGTDGESYLAAMAGLYDSALMKRFLTAGPIRGKIALKREKNLISGSTSQEISKDVPKGTFEVLQGMGLLSQSFAALVEGDSLYYVTGKNAAAKVRQLPSTRPRRPAGPLANALEESAGADALLYFDFGQLARLGGAAMGSGDNPLLSGLRLPLWASYRSGKSATVELRIPMELVKSVGALMPMLMGMGLGQKGLFSP
jgi:hypothetical protein